MDISEMIKQQKSGIIFHRIVYAIFVLVRLFLQYSNDDVNLKNTIFIFVFLILCIGLEEIFYFKDYFHNQFMMKLFRYIQCVLSVLMLCFMQINDISNISIIALFLMFIVDYFHTLNLVDIQSLITYIIYIGIPVIVVMFIKMISIDLNQWIVIVFDIALILLVLFYEAMSLIQYVDTIEKRLYNQQNEMDDILKKNQKIVEIQNKLQDTNYVLNTQKNDLKNANIQIREANQEMAVQAEVLHYILESFDVPKISNQIADAIMRVKDLDFCAVYIRKNVYRNKHDKYAVKAKDENLLSDIKNNMEDVFSQLNERGQTEILYHDEVKKCYPFLMGTSIRTMYAKILCLGEEAYGLFLIGDCRPKLFDENMSFYEAIIAQYNILISNARVYGDMEHMAQKDGLTGINNRIHFNSLFKEEAERVVSNNDCVSVALFDIDKFKSVNDTYGHLAGDEVIKRIASVTEDCIDQYHGFVCRYGGEEFVAVLPGYNIEKSTPVIEELFHKLCEQVVQFNEFEIHMSVSVGLTAYPEVCGNTDDLLKRADWCMYYAKEHGRHQIKVDDGSVQRD